MAADLSLSATPGYLRTFLGILLNKLATGKTSVVPMAPPISKDNFSVTAPTSSPPALAISIRSACCAIPVGTAIAAGTPSCPVNGPTIPFCASLNPAAPAPKNGTKEPAPSASFVVNVSLSLGSDASTDSVRR